MERETLLCTDDLDPDLALDHQRFAGLTRRRRLHVHHLPDAVVPRLQLEHLFKLFRFHLGQTYSLYRGAHAGRPWWQAQQWQ